jgi:NADPH:quinone reductase-like Zn-dependent oxidoreductase
MRSPRSSTRWAPTGIRPVLDRVFPFDDAPEAFRHYLGGTALGKVVITLAPNHERT